MPVPWLAIRPGRSSVQRLTSTPESRGSALCHGQPTQAQLEDAGSELGGAKNA